MKAKKFLKSPMLLAIGISVAPATMFGGHWETPCYYYMSTGQWLSYAEANELMSQAPAWCDEPPYSVYLGCDAYFDRHNGNFYCC